ncbi:SDR family NAD(P)-dependent oxidoreductase [Leucobacter allii]|uniref:SDR family NAD(P)-dependent oxidoreductase n=1 Tax=Leucobacter allii TaxID=2932247 RepID=UPI0032119E05
MQALMQDRVVLVTGGTQGLGRAIAEAAAREGASGIAIVGRNPEKAEVALAAIRAAAAGSADCDAIAIIADLGAAGAAERAVAETVARFGRIDSLVNAAGATSRGTLLDTTRELLEEHLTLNITAPFMTMQGAVADMTARRAPGTILNIISMSMHGGQPYLAPTWPRRRDSRG